MKKILPLLWLLMIAVMVVLSVTPNLIYMSNHSDKMLHIIFYCLFVMAPILMSGRWQIIVPVMLGLLFLGGVIEILQSLVPGRNASFDDIYANISGAFSGLIIGYLIRSGYYAGQNQ